MAPVDWGYLFPVQKTPIPVGDLKGSCQSLDPLHCHIPTSSRCVHRN